MREHIGKSQFGSYRPSAAFLSALCTTTTPPTTSQPQNPANTAYSIKHRGGKGPSHAPSS